MSFNISKNGASVDLKVSAITKESEEPTSPLIFILALSPRAESRGWVIASLSFPSWGDCSKSWEIEVLVNPKNFAAKINLGNFY